jgi:hypothetical protein
LRLSAGLRSLEGVLRTRMAEWLGLLILAGALGIPSSTAADIPSLNVFFQKDRTFLLSLGDGTPVGGSSAPGTTIPAGTYRLNVDDTAQAVMQFHLTGPGVELITNMTFGEDAAQTLVETFQASSTYTYRDDFQASLVRFFSTSSTTSSSGGSGGGASSGSTTAKSGSGGTSPATSQDIVGSGVVPFRGALDAIVFKGGNLSLSRNGKAVTSLKAGRWTFSVDDESKAAGFTVKSLHGKPVTVTSTPYVGSHSVTLTLKAGRWFFFTSGGRQTTFFVSS